MVYWLVWCRKDGMHNGVQRNCNDAVGGAGELRLAFSDIATMSCCFQSQQNEWRGLPQYPQELEDLLQLGKCFHHEQPGWGLRVGDLFMLQNPCIAVGDENSI